MDKKTGWTEYALRMRSALQETAAAAAPDATLRELTRLVAEWAGRFRVPETQPDVWLGLTSTQGSLLACYKHEREKGVLVPVRHVAEDAMLAARMSGTLDNRDAKPLVWDGVTLAFRYYPVHTDAGEWVGTVSLGLPADREDLFAFWMGALYSLVAVPPTAGGADSCLTLKDQERLLQEMKTKDRLFSAAQRLHESREARMVLTEMVGTIKQLYPDTDVRLSLRQPPLDGVLDVGRLALMDAGDIGMRAYREERPILREEGIRGNGATEIALPISGKQAKFGVLHINKKEPFDQAIDLSFLSMLAALAGTAYENAQLFEQSNRLIDELRIINEVTARLNKSLKAEDIYKLACTELSALFAAEGCCILEKQGETLTVQACTEPRLRFARFTSGQGFAGVILASGEPILLENYREQGEDRIASEFMDMTGSAALLGTPIVIQGETKGIILLAHSQPSYFSFENVRLLNALAGHISLALSNALLHAEVRRMVITDNLTGLSVRHYLDEQITLRQKMDLCGSLMVLDIDNFKAINDTFGHQIGDRVLIQVSDIVRSSIRLCDIAARWGGEELAVYFPHIGKDQMHKIAERILQRVVAETDPQVTVSCGIAEWHWEDSKISVESLFYKCDMALYEAKRSGKNQIVAG
ncbi:hypothetical protein J31TS4_30580 [Paenibacillus sp. J31TS4]|uniref:sensor domain-containing diguanylate cyclase n=1 Tax=Paenibacillus sp. J31TS4 TaxID=2807195 RepID=UPI001B1A2E40|nr:sensor domain-containing diguanylate cyclase [Paenibacillus sp. J31TS4]GIP39778.1 hypothetical protein J31TS4_30580 [Paenibacillus sp. J31TS4]